MTAVLGALAGLPLLGAFLALAPGRRTGPIASVTAGLGCLGLALALGPQRLRDHVSWVSCGPTRFR
jgi:hypothetical protein